MKKSSESGEMKMENSALQIMWQQTELWRLIVALFCGSVVGGIYFYSLRWSINHLNEYKHKYRFFGAVALCRIFLFFGVMVLIAQRNAILVLFYVSAFFMIRTIVTMYAKKKFFVQSDKRGEQTDGAEN